MGDEETSPNKERTLNFALLIQQWPVANDRQTIVQSVNQGIPDAEIILIVEAWLESVKEKFKNKFKDNLFFKNPEDFDHSGGK